MSNFNELTWIGKYFEGRINPSNLDIESVRNFVLIWNIFEAGIGNNRMSVEIISNLVDDLDERGMLRIDDFKKYIDFVRGRYVDSLNQIIPRFEFLNLNRNRREVKELVERVLKKEDESLNSTVKALLFITYRMRNNLLHGEKNILTIDTQEQYFKLVNELLAEVMDLHKRAGMINIQARN